MRLILTFLALLGLAGCKTTSELAGNGPIVLSSNAVAAFDLYLESDGLAFAVDNRGQYSFYYYCVEVGCDEGRIIQTTIYECEQRSGRECSLFAIRDRIVWQNPGDWRSGRSGSSNTSVPPDDTSIVEVRAELEERGVWPLFQRAPGHKAVVVRFDQTTGSIRNFGYALGHHHVNTAIEAAHRFCTNDGLNSHTNECFIFGVNNRVYWPLDPFDIPADVLERMRADGERLPAYTGTRTGTMIVDSGDEIEIIATLEMTPGRTQFELSAADGTECRGTSRRQSSAQTFTFAMNCDGSSTVTGDGTYSRDGSVVRGVGTDYAGGSIDFYLGPDPGLLP